MSKITKTELEDLLSLTQEELGNVRQSLQGARIDAAKIRTKLIAAQGNLALMRHEAYKLEERLRRRPWPVRAFEWLDDRFPNKR